MDESTTNAATQEEAQVTAQPPVDEQSAAAVTTDSEPTQPPAEEVTDQETDDASAPSTDDDLADYWSKKGIDINTPEGQRAAAKSYREAEKAMHQKAQQASELEKQINEQPFEVDTDNELLRQIAQDNANTRTALEVQQWKASKSITPAQDEALGQFVTDNPKIGYLVKNGHISYDQLYAMSGVGNVDPSALKKEGGQEALQKLANKQRATAVTGNAVSSAPPAGITKENVDSWWDSLGSEGRRDPGNQAKLDSILSQ